MAHEVIKMASGSIETGSTDLKSPSKVILKSLLESRFKGKSYISTLRFY